MVKQISRRRKSNTHKQNIKKKYKSRRRRSKKNSKKKSKSRRRRQSRKKRSSKRKNRRRKQKGGAVNQSDLEKLKTTMSTNQGWKSKEMPSDGELMQTLNKSNLWLARDFYQRKIIDAKLDTIAASPPAPLPTSNNVKATATITKRDDSVIVCLNPNISNQGGGSSEIQTFNIKAENKEGCYRVSSAEPTDAEADEELVHRFAERVPDGQTRLKLIGRPPMPLPRAAPPVPKRGKKS